jgi:hypothetical protein
MSLVLTVNEKCDNGGFGWLCQKLLNSFRPVQSPNCASSKARQMSVEMKYKAELNPKDSRIYRKKTMKIGNHSKNVANSKSFLPGTVSGLCRVKSRIHALLQHAG